MPQQRIAIDIGNTTATVGLLEPDSIAIDRVFRVPTKGGADALGAQLTAHGARGGGGAVVAIASVVPGAVAAFEHAVRLALETKPLVIGRMGKLPIKVLTRPPEKTGVDRLLNAMAAYRRFGGPTIIADFGTALTVDLCGPDGSFLGGSIVAGPATMAQGLAAAAPVLPLAEIKTTESALGQTTEAALAAGLYHGYVGLVRELLTRMRSDSGRKHKSARAPSTVATGGASEPFASHPGLFDHIVPELTLEGVAIAAGWGEDA